MKPYKHNNRFYNNAQENITHRIFDMIKNFTLSAAMDLLGLRSGKRYFGESSINDWIEKDIHLDATSIVPKITWLGHATFLIQVAGLNIITDPVFSDISFLMPRVATLPIDPKKLPKIDIVLISHNHRDHMDEESLLFLKQYQPKVFVPVGNKQWFKQRGFVHVSQHDWWNEIAVPAEVGDIKFTFLPAVHWTSRGIFDVNKTLWGSWMITSHYGSIYFAGDTASGDHFKLIKEKFARIDVALMPIGPNEPRAKLAQAHISSEEAVDAFLDLGAQHFIPMHWGTFKSCLDTFRLPIDRLEKYWHANSVRLKDKQLHVVKFGETKVFSKPALHHATDIINKQGEHSSF